ncbi:MULTISPECIES: hypothetical protein [unclassified Nocardioides]|uniref:hypothetical protein n=1 Tax=unclassified Nocardioides TaxID=2615069 RepID=UPI003620D550
MRTILTTAALLLALTACGSDDGDSTATDAGPTDAAATTDRPTAVPPAPGSVHTRVLATVMDTGTPELCLGPVAESYPPQCGGPELVGWSWQDQNGVFERQGDTRWGQFHVTGTWDGERLTVSGAIPAALYDAMPVEGPTHPEPAESLGQADLERIQAEVQDLPGAQGAYVDGPRVIVDAVYDDGSLQTWADQTYGEAVVVVVPALVDDE